MKNFCKLWKSGCQVKTLRFLLLNVYGGETFGRVNASNFKQASGRKFLILIPFHSEIIKILHGEILIFKLSQTD